MTAATSRRWRSVEYALWTVGVLCVGSFLLVQSGRQAAAHMQAESFLNQTQGLPDAGVLADLATRERDQRVRPESRSAAFNQPPTDSTEDAARGVLRIPNLGLEVPVYAGTDNRTLSRGAGWVAGTAPIESSGNVAIAGHRDSFFRALKDISPEDIIELTGPDSTIRYRVTDTWIVEPDAVHVLDPTPYGAVTLITCYPFYYIGHAPQRFIVRATAVKSF